TPQSVGSEIPLTAPNADSLHDNALCRTLELLAAVYANGKAISLFLLSDFGVSYQNMIAATRNLFGFAPSWLMHLLGSELGGCAVDVDTAIAALTDTDAQLEYACCLRDELRSAVISEANWNAALTTCAGSLAGNAGIIACLMDFDNNQDHALAFFEVYSRMLERQAAGEDFVCECVPDGWFWVDHPFEWLIPEHGGQVQSPLLRVTNPANGDLEGIVTRYRNTGPGFGGFRMGQTDEPDELVPIDELPIASGLWFHCNIFVGTCEGADAVDWQNDDRNDVDWNTPPRAAGQTWSVIFSHHADQGQTASGIVKNVRFLYKEVP
ncbi:MAG: hypothetical protein J3T61_12460, partial [Candidatus Brocadiales bacterium]|nr:hypothetical protein [Candidatus Bathyanammoxibius sp.]